MKKLIFGVALLLMLSLMGWAQTAPAAGPQTGFWKRAVTVGARTYKSQPLCAYAAAANALGRTPGWVFHGAKDEAVPVAKSRQLAAAFQAAGHPAKYTEYPTKGHFIADKANADPAFWDWLLAQNRPALPTAAAT